MSNLYLHLQGVQQSTKTLSLNAQSVIETTLTVSAERASLPTLISIENIIERINENGFELVDNSEIERIACLLHDYYLPTPMMSWQDKSLDLSVNRISISPEQYKEFRDIRSAVKKAVRDVNYYETKGDPLSSKKAQDAALMMIARSVEKKPSWWEKNRGKLLKFAGKTAIGLIIDILVGIPLGTFVRSVFGYI